MIFRKLRSGKILATAAAVALMISGRANADAVVEKTLESRLQLDFHVPEKALAAFIPQGWETNIATSGPAKDANLRVVFVNRSSVTGADGKRPDGKRAGRGADRLVYLAIPIKQSGSATNGQMIIAGITGDKAAAPGPFGVYLPATSRHLARIILPAEGGNVSGDEDWAFAADAGEQISIHVKYERPAVTASPREVRFVSGKDPKLYQISKADQAVAIVRNATVDMPDRVKQFSYKIGGGRIAALFDGTERVLSVDVMPIYNEVISAP